MIEEHTKRLICKTEMIISNGIPTLPQKAEKCAIDLLSLHAQSGMEYGFMFFDKETSEYVCQIHFENKRRDFEISYGTEEQYRKNGYMKEALIFFKDWVFSNTLVSQLYALITQNPISQHTLQVCGFEYEKHDDYGDWFVIHKNDSNVSAIK